MNSNGQIKAPISLKDDVYYVLGISPSGAYYDLAEACSSDKINKWSKYKPMVPYTDKPEPLTEADIQSALCGLSPATLTYLRSSHDDYYPQEIHTKSEILGQVKEWEFVRKPLLGKNNWFRLTDFSNASNPNQYGYNHNAEPSDKDWESYSMLKSELNAMIEKTVTITRTNNSPTDFTVDNQFYRMDKFSIVIGTNTGQHIGDGNTNMLPLVAAAGGGFIEDEDWRIAYAIHLPYDGLTTSATDEWYLFIGRKPLKYGVDFNFAEEWFVPDMSTNTRAVNMILTNFSRSANQERITFDMIPCLVKNAKIKLDSFTQGVQLSHVYLESDAMIYAMPSGAQPVQLTVTRVDEEIPNIDGLTEIAKYGDHEDAWILGYVQTGNGGPNSNIPIQMAVVARAVPLTNESWSGVVNVGFRFYKLDGNMEEQEYEYPNGCDSGYTVEYPISGTDKVTINGVTYSGIVLSKTVENKTPSGLGFRFTSDQVKTFTVGNA